MWVVPSGRSFACILMVPLVLMLRLFVWMVPPACPPPSPADWADLVARRQKLPRRALRRTLYGPYYYLPKQQRIVRRVNGDPTKTLFVKFVLEVLWQVYHQMMHGDIEGRQRIAKVLRVAGQVPVRRRGF